MSTLKVSNITDTSGGATTLVSAQNTAKAWVNFNGTGTPAIRDSYNISSIADEGTGSYTVTFTNALSDGNYAAIGNGGEYRNDGQTNSLRSPSLGLLSAGSFYMDCRNANNALADPEVVCFTIFGDNP